MALINKIHLTEIENFKDLSAEFYKEEYMMKAAAIRKRSFRKLGLISFITDGEHGSPSWSDSSGIKYVTAEFIKENYIEHGITKQITIEQDKRNERARLKEGDILIYSVGAYAGLACVAEPHLFPANIPRSVAIVRLNNNNEYLPEFVSVFLNANTGKFQAFRFRAGNSQPVLALEKIKQFEIPLIDLEFQLAVKKLYNEAYQLRLNSQDLYQQAVVYLEKELALNRGFFQADKKYTTSFKKVIKSIRLDANHFNPKFDQLIAHLNKICDTKRIGYLTNFNRRGLQPNYSPNGEIDIVNSQHITSTHLSYDTFEKTTLDDFQSASVAQIKEGDILIYTTGAYVGMTNVYLSDKPALASNHVNILRLKDDSIDPAYVALVLNTTVGKMQTEMHIRGSAQAELYPHDIAKFIIPLLDVEKMKEIGDLVRDSLKASQMSKRLLLQAKEKVEQQFKASVEKNAKG